METPQNRPIGMMAFTIVWIGQVVSLLGTAMSNFALTLWAYEVTGKATPLALVGFFFVTPMVVLGPFVGVLVDRSNRKLMMMLSDLAAALTTVIVLILYATGNLQIWHLYVTATISGIFQGFQWPAYSAAIALMLPKEQYGRANGMLELAGNASRVFAPMILGRTGNDELIFGSVQSAGAIGGVVGGLAMSAWGGPKRRVHGVLLGWFCLGLLGQTVLGLGRALPVWAVGIFVLAFFGPIINGANQGIWQAKVAPDVQGRVFTTRRLIAWLVSPISRLLAGPLADQVLEPAMAEGGSLAPVFSWLVGTGTGAGIALLFVFTGLLAALTGLSGYLFPVVRNAEDILPDHDAVVAQA